MTCKDIIIKWLKDNGYDGLAGEHCGCGLDDLAPCCDDILACVPAHRKIANEDDSERDIRKGDVYYEARP